MSIWSPQDVARDFVRRHAAGLDAQDIARKVAEAAQRKRETAADARHGTRPSEGLVGLDIDPQLLADSWAAKHVEWRRVQALLAASGRPVYAPADDEAGSRWAREREQHHEQRLAAAAAHREQLREERSAAAFQLRLTADTAAPLYQAAARLGLTPQQVLAHLAARVETGHDGSLSVPAFHLDHP
ncbi:hypothetical protein ACFQ8C_31180 [Streptomyces sp. NPDC056503]|uniref:hypothetical protein n=1 Tax=Streptomyces sp. NPDC056503 TaxID=3345842 RepID=UPI0036D002B0